VMIIAMFMILEQLKIAEEIVRIAFAATMFALALGLALAFGLGGRDLAGRMLDDAYRKGKEHQEQAKRDIRMGRERAESQMGSSSGYSTGSFSGSTSPTEPRPGSGSSGDPGATQAWPSEPSEPPEPPENRI
jgi:uncharacterized membrane protein YgcG